MAEEKITGNKRILLIILLCCAVVLALFFVHLLRRFDSYSVKSSVLREDADETRYVQFQGNLLKYSRDGAFYTDYDNHLIWNHTYEMGNPQLEICGSYILIYDKTGTQLCVLSPTGIKKSIKTSFPIVDADVSEQGMTAVLMQEDDTGYLQMYDLKGETLASGELHTKNSGYPIAIALSSDGEKLMVSLMNLNDGDMKAVISFYHFGSLGKKTADNVVASYSYTDLVIPEIDFVKNDKAVAFGDKQIILYGNSNKPKVEKEIYVSEQMKSVFYNDDYFGVITDRVTKEGSTENVMTVYSMNGHKRFDKVVDIPYQHVEFLDNNEIFFTDSKEIALYTMQGIKKFAYTFETSIYKIIPQDTSRRYVLIKNGTTEKVRLQ